MKKFKFLFILIFIFSFHKNGFAQLNFVDSLIKTLPKEKPDSNKLKKLVRIAGNLVFEDPKKSELYIGQAIDLCKSVDNAYWKAWAYHTLGELESRKGNFNKSILNLKIAIHLFDSLHQNVLAARCEYGIGTSYLNMGNYEKGLYHTIQAETRFNKLGNREEASNVMVSKASIYAFQKQFDLQIKELEKCIEIKKEINDSNGLPSAYIELSIPYIAKNNFKKAEEILNYAFKILQKKQNPYYLKSALGNLGLIFKLKKEYVKAIDFFTQSLEISKQYNDNKGMSESNNKIADAYLGLKNSEKSLQFGFEALKISETNGDISDQKFSCEIISQAYELSKNFEKSLFYHKKFKELEDSMLNLKNIESLNEANIKFNTEKSEAQNKLLEASNKLSMATIRQQKIISYFIIGGLVLTIGLAFFIFRGLKQQRKANKIISEQKLLVEHQKELVEEKQKEVLDSIRYAKRIQTALITNEKYIDKVLKNLTKK